MKKKKLPYFPLYVNDFIGDTQDLTNEEIGAYIRILMYSWGKGKFKLNRIKFILDSPDVWAEIKQYFTCEDDLWFNPRMERERERVFGVIEARSEAGKAGAKARWDNKGNAIANSKEDSKGNSKNMPAYTSELIPKNLRTDNSEPIKREKQKRFSPPLLIDVIKRMIDTSLKSHIEQPRAEVEAEKFINFYSSNGWKVGKNKMVSWESAVSNWLLRLEPVEENYRSTLQ